MKAGDDVKHIPTGEEWVLAGVDTKRGEVYPAGWPESIADIKDCELILSCSDKESLETLRQCLSLRPSDVRHINAVREMLLPAYFKR